MRPLLVLALLQAGAHAQEPPRPPARDKPRPLLAARELPLAAAQALALQAEAHALELAAPVPPSEPASEALLGPVRPLYQNMEFGKAARALAAGEEALLAGRLPTPQLARALAEAELWLGALLWLDRDKGAAADHWALAQRLVPSARPDRLFPPQVQQAFAQRPVETHPVAVAIKLAPVGARLWLDGKRVTGNLTATPGLHWVVVERADFKPSVQLLRITLAVPQIAVDLREPAAPAEALARATSVAMGRDEGLGVSGLIKRPLWIVTAPAGKWSGARFASADPTRPVVQLSDEGAAPLVEAILVAEGLGPPPPVAPAEVVSPPPPKRPLWKRGWFWGTVAAAVVVVAGVAVGASLGVTAARDYDLHVR
jgi:hypothetical protein